jgi:hypothetical protein
VTAKEKNTGLAKTVTMDTRGAAVLDMDQARRNIASLIGEPEAGESGADGDANEALEAPEALLATAKDLRKRGEALLAQNINADDAGEIRELIHHSAEAIADRDWKSLSRTNDTLSDLIFYLED